MVPLGIPHSEFLGWDPMDQDKALGYLREQRSICKCGTRKQEWEADRFAYVGQQRSCPGCDVLSQERKNVPEHAVDYTYAYLVPASQALSPEEEGSET